MTAGRPPRYWCPRCARKWLRRAMEPIDNGSWTGSRRVQCTECGLIDYPDEPGPRRFGSLREVAAS